MFKFDKYAKQTLIMALSKKPTIPLLFYKYTYMCVYSDTACMYTCNSNRVGEGAGSLGF